MATKPPKQPSTTSTQALLSSFYIYNPSLGKTDSTVRDQLIFHYSAPPAHKTSSPKSSPFDSVSETDQDLDKQLRAVGLAQGIVEFARAFSPDSPVQEVRTQKGFTVPLEVEKGWWMLATVEVPNPVPIDVITPSLLHQLLLRAYRRQRLQLRSLKYLYREHSLQHLVSTIRPYYNAFVETVNSSLTRMLVELDFDAVRWSCQPLDQSTRSAFTTWLRKAKSEKSLIDALLFRAPKETLPYEPQREGLLFAGLQDGNLSSENIRDIGLLISTLDVQEKPQETDTNGDVGGKRSVSFPGFSQSWDSVVETSSSLFSALSFGTVPAKRSPLALPQDARAEPVKKLKGEGRWIIGGDKDGTRIWLEAGGERMVPISLGNARPGFLRELSGQQSPGDDDLVEVELAVYKYNDLLFTFVLYPSTAPPDSFRVILPDISSPSTIPRPPTPQSLKPFILLHDPLTFRLYSSLPPIPPPTPTPTQSFSLTPKRNPKRDPWPRDHALQLHTHILRLREQYNRHSPGVRVREYTAKTPNFFIFRTLVSTEERGVADFAEGWYIVKTGGQVGMSGLGRGDDAGGLEDIAKQGRERCREVWKEMSVQYTSESDED